MPPLIGAYASAVLARLASSVTIMQSAQHTCCWGGTMMWTRPRLIALIAAGAVLGLGFAFAAGWFAHQEYVAWRLSQVFSEGPFASDSSDSSSSETASKGDIEDPK